MHPVLSLLMKLTLLVELEAEQEALTAERDNTLNQKLVKRWI